MNSSGFQKD